MEASLSDTIGEIVKRGFVTIDMTHRHGLPNRQGALFKSEPVDDPIVNGIVRDGVVLQLVHCVECGEVVSAAPGESNPLCSFCD